MGRRTVGGRVPSVVGRDRAHEDGREKKGGGGGQNGTGGTRGKWASEEGFKAHLGHGSMAEVRRMGGGGETRGLGHARACAWGSGCGCVGIIDGGVLSCVPARFATGGESYVPAVFSVHARRSGSPSRRM